MATDQKRGRQEDAHQLRELTLHPGWRVLTDQVRNQLDAKQAALIAGVPKDFAAYKWEAGWCRGALDVLEAPARAEEQAR